MSRLSRLYRSLNTHTDIHIYTSRMQFNGCFCGKSVQHSSFSSVLILENQLLQRATHMQHTPHWLVSVNATFIIVWTCDKEGIWHVPHLIGQSVVNHISLKKGIVFRFLFLSYAHPEHRTNKSNGSNHFGYLDGFSVHRFWLWILIFDYYYYYSKVKLII